MSKISTLLRTTVAMATMCANPMATYAAVNPPASNLITTAPYPFLFCPVGFIQIGLGCQLFNTPTIPISPPVSPPAPPSGAGGIGGGF